MTKKTLNLTLGCDPEVFVRDKENKIIPICGLIGAGKDNPLKIADGVCVQEDGVALEFNVDPIDYLKTNNDLYSVTQKAVATIDAWLYDGNKNTIGRGLYIDSRYSEWHFKPTELADPRANTIGCDPDFDAWKGGTKRMSFSTEQFGGDRYCGGHLHLGYDTSKVSIPRWAIVQFIDALAESPLYYSGYAPGGVKRSQFYGMPGIYREKPYGLEYRTPNNAWIFGRNTISSRVANVVMWAINNQSQAREVFDKLDKQAAQHLKQNRPGQRDAIGQINSDIYQDVVVKYKRSLLEQDEEGFPIAQGEVGEVAIPQVDVEGLRRIVAGRANVGVPQERLNVDAFQRAFRQ